MSAASYFLAIYSLPEDAQAIFGRNSSLNALAVHHQLAALEVVGADRLTEVVPAELAPVVDEAAVSDDVLEFLSFSQVSGQGYPEQPEIE